MYDPKGLFVILKKSSVLKLKYESEKRKALFMLSFDSKFSKRKVLERAEFLKSIIARKQIPLYNNLTNYSGLAMGFLANSERIKTTRQLQFSSLPESLVKQLNEMILRLINSLRIDLVRITKLGPQIIIYLKKEQELLEELGKADGSEYALLIEKFKKLSHDERALLKIWKKEIKNQLLEAQIIYNKIKNRTFETVGFVGEHAEMIVALSYVIVVLMLISTWTGYYIFPVSDIADDILLMGQNLANSLRR